ncbi:MAG: nitroreductase [Dehalococcoidia bacterium]|nr:nitroreductase [Chloroflexota bacterium]MBR97599.1 nitroreductase [Dehalococcoidia bacterium]|tara:strand:+ start:1048 stop:1470 length:423 start_codon:yes stop_codon:yes gene_type:complete
MATYIPSPKDWVAAQVELYEGSGGIDGTTLKGLPVVIVTNKGWKTGAIRKTPLMRVEVGGKYVLVASQGGAPKHPLWYHNLKADPKVKIQDGTEIYEMTVREVTDESEKSQLWKSAVEAYPPYEEYQERTSRPIPVFLAE